MGKYIKKFDTHSDYEDFIETEDFIRPNVSYCVDNKDVHYNSTQTLFALEIENGRFISFYFQNGVLYANTDDGSSALWVLDGNGVVVDNISYSIADRAPILAQINEHFGTSFTRWSDNEIGLRVGDSLPNWNAYEKIEMQSQKIAALYYESGENSLFIIGTLRGEDFEIITNGGYGCTVSINGVLIAYDVDPEYERDYILGVLQGLGITAASLSEKEVSWEVGSTVPNWSEYTQYK